MDRILVPTDFSEHSGFALEYASFLAKKNNSELYVLHIVRNPSYIKSAQEKLNEVLSNDYLASLNAKLVLEEGNNVSKTINQVGKKIGVDLIVMGSNGASNVEEIILGSNTENVIIKTKFDVLTVKHQMKSPELKSILFASDFSPESYAIFETVKKFAKLFNSTIHLLRVTKSEKPRIQEKMNLFIEYHQLKEEGINYEVTIMNNSSVELGILNYAVDANIDLIAIGTHGKGALKKLIQESTSQNLVRDAFRPVLTMRF